jgi:hypothetical protein
VRIGKATFDGIVIGDVLQVARHRIKAQSRTRIYVAETYST